jgi:hypothetical protein
MTDEEIREKLMKVDPLADDAWLEAAIVPARAALAAPTLVAAEEILSKACWGRAVEAARELRGASECKACQGRGYV